MKIVFVNYHDMSCNSAIHIRCLSRELASLGHQCIAAVGDDLWRESDDEPWLRVIKFSDLREPAKTFGGEMPDVVVAWTPRENVRRAATRLIRNAAKMRPDSAPKLIVHLEDNELSIVARNFGVSAEGAMKLSAWKCRKFEKLALTVPRRMASFLREASAITGVTARLSELCPEGKRFCELTPGYEKMFEEPSADSVRRARERLAQAGGAPGADGHLIVYTGNVHKGNADDVALMLDGVGALRKAGRDVALAMTGEIHDVGFWRKNGFRDGVFHLGLVGREVLPGLLACADLLVQPGGPGEFNDYRFPSKLPEFLVSGKPVVLPETNIGLKLRDRVDAMVLATGSLEELTRAICELLDNPRLAQSIGVNGRAFAIRHLQWPAAAQALDCLLGALREPMR